MGGIAFIPVILPATRPVRTRSRLERIPGVCNIILSRGLGAISKPFALECKGDAICKEYDVPNLAVKVAVSALIAAAIALSIPSTCSAISGGGKDYASKNWTGTDFSNGSYVEKDFSGGLFRGCDFSGSDLTSARFFKAELREANLTGANLSFASIEAATLRDAILKDAVMTSAYISDSILDAASIENVDFTDALISPESTIAKLCQRPDATGTNPATGVPTRERYVCYSKATPNTALLPKPYHHVCPLHCGVPGADCRTPS